MIRTRLVDLIRRTKTVGDCYVWQGAQVRVTYARNAHSTHTYTLTRSAHRVAYAIVHKVNIDHIQLRNLCGRKRCINPDHWEPIPRRTYKRKRAP
jgi:hypothetical protein